MQTYHPLNQYSQPATRPMSGLTGDQAATLGVLGVAAIVGIGIRIALIYGAYKYYTYQARPR
jgi:hypothetical protein